MGIELTQIGSEVREMNRNVLGVATVSTPSVSKYHNKRVTLDGMTFDSGKEAARARELILLHQAKQIFALAFQVAFPVAKDIIYVADFVYLDDKLQPVIEDVKSEGTKTPAYRMKKKLFREKYNQEITEI